MLSAHRNKIPVEWTFNRYNNWGISIGWMTGVEKWFEVHCTVEAEQKSYNKIPWKRSKNNVFARRYYYASHKHSLISFNC